MHVLGVIVVSSVTSTAPIVTFVTLKFIALSGVKVAVSAVAMRLQTTSNLNLLGIAQSFPIATKSFQSIVLTEFVGLIVQFFAPIGKINISAVVLHLIVLHSPVTLRQYNSRYHMRFEYNALIQHKWI